MKISIYSYKTNEKFLDYEFESVGPKGKVKKVARFLEIGKDVFNLGFGDLHPVTGEINDTIVTNNNDSRKVLATVAAIVDVFTLKYPGAWVMAKGSTRSRNRLYRMGISNHWHEIKKRFEVFGLKKVKWELFRPHSDYEAFLIRRR